MPKITSKSKNEISAWILKANVLLNLWLTETGAIMQHVNNKARKSKYSRTSIKGPPIKQPSIKRPPIKRPTFIWQPAAKLLQKIVTIHCNKNLNSTATSIKRPQSACCPKGVFVLFYTPIKWQVRGILVYYIRLINISNSVLDGATNKSVLNIERS